MVRSTSMVLLSIFALQLAACYDWVAIQPTELPKLNESYNNSMVVATQQVTVVTNDKSVRHVQGADGTLKEIKGEFDARVKTATDTLLFGHPVGAEVHDDTLSVLGGNRPRTDLRLADVKSVEVSQFNRAETTALGGAVGLALGLLVVLLVTR